MLIGYCRISISDQNLDLQKDALLKFGCEDIYQDVASGARSDRSGLNEAKKYLRKGIRSFCGNWIGSGVRCAI